MYLNACSTPPMKLPPHRSDVVKLSELEAKTVLCIVSGSAGKLAGYM